MSHVTLILHITFSLLLPLYVQNLHETFHLEHLQFVVFFLSFLFSVQGSVACVKTLITHTFSTFNLVSMFMPVLFHIMLNPAVVPGAFSIDI